jgi:hypothetical protein
MGLARLFYPLWKLLDDLIRYFAQKNSSFRCITECFQGKSSVRFQKSFMSNLEQCQLPPDFVDVRFSIHLCLRFNVIQISPGNDLLCRVAE